MKLLLTSGGLTNDSIKNALEEMVGKPRKEIKIAFIPTAAFCKDDESHESKDWLIDDLYRIKEFCGHITIVSLADQSPSEMISDLEYADVIFVGGGNTFYLSYMMKKFGLFEMLPKLLETRVYVGISAGSMIACSSLRASSQALRSYVAHEPVEFDKLGPAGRSSGTTLGFVPFIIRPHFGSESRGFITNDLLTDVAHNLETPIYAIDDQSALKVVNGNVEVITEGTWKLFK